MRRYSSVSSTSSSSDSSGVVASSHSVNGSSARVGRRHRHSHHGHHRSSRRSHSHSKHHHHRKHRSSSHSQRDKERDFFDPVHEFDAIATPPITYDPLEDYAHPDHQGGKLKDTARYLLHQLHKTQSVSDAGFSYLSSLFHSGCPTFYAVSAHYHYIDGSLSEALDSLKKLATRWSRDSHSPQAPKQREILSLLSQVTQSSNNDDLNKAEIINYLEYAVYSLDATLFAAYDLYVEALFDIESRAFESAREKQEAVQHVWLEFYETLRTFISRRVYAVTTSTSSRKQQEHTHGHSHTHALSAHAQLANLLETVFTHTQTVATSKADPSDSNSVEEYSRLTHTDIRYLRELHAAGDVILEAIYKEYTRKNSLVEHEISQQQQQLAALYQVITQYQQFVQQQQEGEGAERSESSAYQDAQFNAYLQENHALLSLMDLTEAERRDQLLWANFHDFADNCVRLAKSWRHKRYIKLDDDDDDDDDDDEAAGPEKEEKEHALPVAQDGTYHEHVRSHKLSEEHLSSESHDYDIIGLLAYLQQLLEARRITKGEHEFLESLVQAKQPTLLSAWSICREQLHEDKQNKASHHHHHHRRHHHHHHERNTETHRALDELYDTILRILDRQVCLVYERYTSEAYSFLASLSAKYGPSFLPSASLSYLNDLLKQKNDILFAIFVEAAQSQNVHELIENLLLLGDKWKKHCKYPDLLACLVYLHSHSVLSSSDLDICENLVYLSDPFLLASWVTYEESGYTQLYFNEFLENLFLRLNSFLKNSFALLQTQLLQFVARWNRGDTANRGESEYFAIQTHSSASAEREIMYLRTIFFPTTTSTTVPVLNNQDAAWLRAQIFQSHPIVMAACAQYNDSEDAVELLDTLMRLLYRRNYAPDSGVSGTNVTNNTPYQQTESVENHSYSSHASMANDDSLKAIIDKHLKSSGFTEALGQAVKAAFASVASAREVAYEQSSEFFEATKQLHQMFDNLFAANYISKDSHLIYLEYIYSHNMVLYASFDLYKRQEISWDEFWHTITILEKYYIKQKKQNEENQYKLNLLNVAIMTLKRDDQINSIESIYLEDLIHSVFDTEHIASSTPGQSQASDYAPSVTTLTASGLREYQLPAHMPSTRVLWAQSVLRAALSVFSEAAASSSSTSTTHPTKKASSSSTHRWHELLHTLKHLAKGLWKSFGRASKTYRLYQLVTSLATSSRSASASSSRSYSSRVNSATSPQGGTEAILTVSGYEQLLQRLYQGDFSIFDAFTYAIYGPRNTGNRRKVNQGRRTQRDEEDVDNGAVDDDDVDLDDEDDEDDDDYEDEDDFDEDDDDDYEDDDDIDLDEEEEDDEDGDDFEEYEDQFDEQDDVVRDEL